MNRELDESVALKRYLRRRNDVNKARSRAPLRLGLAGGGTDVSPYSDQFGGCVLNASINLYAYCTVEVLDEDKVEFVAKDLQQRFEAPLAQSYSLDGELLLHKAVYNCIVSRFTKNHAIPLRISTYADAPPGSGLGTSSTMVVSILAALRELLKLPLGEYDIAQLAFEIERIDCKLSGGKQDQYAAAFGGFNFMEFYKDKTIINPLRMRDHIINELHARMLLYFTGRSRDSAKIIEEQIKAVRVEKPQSVESMHEVKRIAYEMKEKLLKNQLDSVTQLFRDSWDAKKRLSNSISNSHINLVADRAFSAGADAIKISGAGGGGFMMIIVDPERKLDVVHALSPAREELEFRNDYFVKFNFSLEGVQSWPL